MSATLPRADAGVDADYVTPSVDLLRRRLMPACEDAVIAGSLRRGLRFISDAEIVCLPRMGADLFGEIAEDYPALDLAIDELVRCGMLAFDERVRRNGPRYKRLILRNCDDLPVDLFIADRANFGNVLAIRTGPAGYSQQLVTKRPRGMMPFALRQEGGYLRRERDNEIVPCRNESEYFRALGVRMPAPALRGANEEGADGLD